MYEKEINLPQKITSRECVLRGPQNGHKRLQWGIRGGGGLRSHATGYMAHDFGLLGRWPTDQKFQNDQCNG